MSHLLCFFFIIITLLSLHVPISVLAIDDAYQNCGAPVQCGGLDISYPFWGGDRSEYCGYPGFNLDCKSGVPQITLADRTYRVLQIDHSSNIVNVTRQDYWDNTCPTNPGNSPLNFTLFDYTSDTQNITLYYGCLGGTEIPPSLSPYRFNCSSDETSTANYFLTSSSIVVLSAYRAYFGSCSNVQFAVSQSTVDSINTDPLLVNSDRVFRDGFGLRWNANNTLCNGCARSKGHCGYDSDNSEFTCYCPDGPHPDTCPSKGEGSFFNRRWKISIAITAAVVGMIIIITILLIIASRRNYALHNVMVLLKKKTENDQKVEAFVRNLGSLPPKIYSYSDVRKMTNSFRDKLGQGGYGDVYKGKLVDGRLVAVKFLKESKGNGEEFTNEVASISRTSHVNIVNLLGFCYERNKRALIYEFMPNGSLDKFSYDKESPTTNPRLEWKTMYQIAVGIARGIEYLHTGCNTRIVHFDIKPHNILLDQDFCPKISDFRLAKLCKKKGSIISMMCARGTIGYIAPELVTRNFGEVSHKPDVYSYGMIILEMVGERKYIDVGVSQSRTSDIYFPNWIYKQLEQGKDFEFQSAVAQEEKEVAKKMVLVSLWCIQTIPSDRPSITRVLEMLQGGMEHLKVPPKPSLASQTRSPQHFSSISSLSSAA